MKKKYVYMVQTIWSTDDNEGVDTELFDNYKKALDGYYNSIDGELRDTWITAHITETGFDNEVTFESDNHHFNDEQELYRSWSVRQNNDWYFYTTVTLDIKELR